MTTTVLEVERKFDVGASVDVPDLGGAPGVARVAAPQEHALEATYFDTADLRLRAAGVTLRHRRGGPDAGWHLKLPAGADREELRVEGKDLATRVPSELAALVRVHVRDRELVPVARLSTTRMAYALLDEDGRVLVEVVDDAVTGELVGMDDSATRWREWEAELVEGDRSLLDAVSQLLLAAGATPSGSGSKVGRVLARRPASPRGEDAPLPWWSRPPATPRKATAGGVLLDHLRAQVAELVERDPQARRDLPDAVHKMRVATRRLRSALTTYRPLLDRAVTDPVRDELRWLAGVLGGPRDAEVMHARLRQLVEAQPDELVLGPVRDRIDTAMRQRHRAAHEAMISELDGPRYLALLDTLDQLVAAPPLLPRAKDRAVDVLPGLVRRTWKRLDRAMCEAEQAPAGEPQDLRLHEARKDAKRVRYAAESVVPVFGRKAARFASRMEELQEVLGEHNDGVVLRGALRELAVQAHGAGENGFTFGLLSGVEQARAEQAAARWPQVRKAASRRRLRRWLTD